MRDQGAMCIAAVPQTYIPGVAGETFLARSVLKPGGLDGSSKTTCRPSCELLSLQLPTAQKGVESLKLPAAGTLASLESQISQLRQQLARCEAPGLGLVMKPRTEAFWRCRALALVSRARSVRSGLRWGCLLVFFRLCFAEALFAPTRLPTTAETRAQQARAPVEGSRVFQEQ